MWQRGSTMEAMHDPGENIDGAMFGPVGPSLA